MSSRDGGAPRERDRAETVIVLAKEPVAGRVKTRLQSAFAPAEAASLAAASITDTQVAVLASGVVRRVLAWQGDPSGWDTDFEVTPQPDGSLNRRLAAAFRAAYDGSDRPVLLIGMDTPQVTPALINSRWEGADAVLGLSEDGGFWAIGLRGVDPDSVFDGIAMSTDRTGSAQLARLDALGLSVRLLPPLRDIDLPEDLEAVCYSHPGLAVSRQYAAILATRRRQPPDRIFDDLYRGLSTSSRCSGSAVGLADGVPLTLEPARWEDTADAADQLVVARCEAPVVDLGCGPGRMVRALQASGRAALGIDISAEAVDHSRSGGGQALRRRIVEPLPAEGRWGTVLLLDGNIGIGGDVLVLLRRCRDLVAPGGLIICEVDRDPLRDDVRQIVLTSSSGESEPFPWAAVGARCVLAAASTLDLVLVEEWRADDRVFVALRSHPARG